MTPRGVIAGEELEVPAGSSVLTCFPRATLLKPFWYLELHVNFYLKKGFHCLREFGSHSSREVLRKSNLFLVMAELKGVGQPAPHDLFTVEFQLFFPPRYEFSASNVFIFICQFKNVPQSNIYYLNKSSILDDP